MTAELALVEIVEPGDRELAAITAEIHDVRQAARRFVLEQAIRIGQLLVEARPLFPHNDKAFLNWAHDEFTYQRRHVFNLMKLAEEVQRVALLPPETSIRRALAALVPQTGMFSSDTPEWYTPADIIERTVALLGAIDLDPCSNEGSPNVPAARYFTAADDGLRQIWSGRVYMNPPYGAVIGDWMTKLRDEHVAGRVPEAIALVPARTDTAWWQDNLSNTSICYVRGRLRFSGHENSAPFPSAVVYFGKRRTEFWEEFDDVGEIRGHVWRLEVQLP